jgi:adenylyltransferase/sulfurtransferase
MKNASRYSRQIIFPSIGEAGQGKITKSSVAIVGCGALGCISASLLARAGVGTITLIDRDFVELENLQRQTLFTEEDARNYLPKAPVLAERLKQANSEIKLVSHISDLNHRNAEELLSSCDVVVDATDNLETRFLINDVCVKHKIPWVYGAAVGSTGMVKTILPGRTSCLRCFIRDMPAPSSLPTCETAGILNSVPGVVGSLQVSETLKIIVGKTEISGDLIYVDVWANRFDVVEVKRREDCPACVRGSLEFLSGKLAPSVSRLCGRNSVEIVPDKAAKLDLERLRDKLANLGDVRFNGYLLIFKTGELEIFIFPDARAIIKGTYDFSMAKTLYSKFVGS